MAGDQRDDDTREPEGGSELLGSEQGEALTSAERKRLSARRRFLAGGAIALPLIVSVSRKSFADGGWEWDDGFSKKKKSGAGRSLCVTMAVKKTKKIGKKVGKKGGGKKSGKKGGKKKGKKTFVSLVCKSKTKKI